MGYRRLYEIENRRYKTPAEIQHEKRVLYWMLGVGGVFVPICWVVLLVLVLTQSEANGCGNGKG